MTEQKPQHKGRDFAIGFTAGLLPVATALLLTKSTAGSGFFFLISGTGLLLCAMGAFIRRRKFISLGILSLMITAPLLICGACATY